MDPVTCDACAHVFVPELKVRRRTGYGETASMRCPECKKRYPVYKLSEKGIVAREALMAAREALRQSAQRGDSGAIYDRLYTTVLAAERAFQAEYRAGK